MRTSKKLNLEQVLTVGDGGSSGPKAQGQPSPSLAPEETQPVSSTLAQPEQRPTSTHPGSQPSDNGGKPVLTVKNGSTIPNSTLAGTANWVLTLLSKRKLITFSLVHGANGDFYSARFGTKDWIVKSGVLTLKNTVSTSETEPK